MRPTCLFLPVLLAVGSCKSPPQPPTADPATRRPANTAAAIDAQASKSEAQNARILADESARAARAAADAAARLATQLQAQRPQGSCAEPPRNRVYTILFPFGSAQLPASVHDTWQLVEDSRSAALVVLSGRTDGSAPTAGEARIARERATAVQAYLIAAGVPPARIRATWQPVGDHAADNDSPQGRALNRRVEIEIYRAAPEPASSDAQRQL